MKIKRTRMTVKCFYYQCEVCGRQIDSYEYYAYGRCQGCRWAQMGGLFMICEHCKKRNECKVAEAYIAMKDIIRITECDEYEEDKKTNKIVSIFDYFGRK